jgi:hypothetical protein
MFFSFEEAPMPVLPSILNGGAACAAVIESVLTMLLYQQVRRYNADVPKPLPPRRPRPIDRKPTRAKRTTTHA